MEIFFAQILLCFTVGIQAIVSLDYGQKSGKPDISKGKSKYRNEEESPKRKRQLQEVIHFPVGLQSVAGGIAAPYRNDERQKKVNALAVKKGASDGTAQYYGVPGTASASYPIGQYAVHYSQMRHKPTKSHMITPAELVQKTSGSEQSDSGELSQIYQPQNWKQNHFDQEEKPESQKPPSNSLVAKAEESELPEGNYEKQPYDYVNSNPEVAELPQRKYEPQPSSYPHPSPFNQQIPSQEQRPVNYYGQPDFSHVQFPYVDEAQAPASYAQFPIHPHYPEFHPLQPNHLPRQVPGYQHQQYTGQPHDTSGLNHDTKHMQERSPSVESTLQVNAQEPSARSISPQQSQIAPNYALNYNQLYPVSAGNPTQLQPPASEPHVYPLNHEQDGQQSQASPQSYNYYPVRYNNGFHPNQAYHKNRHLTPFPYQTVYLY